LDEIIKEYVRSVLFRHSVNLTFTSRAYPNGILTMDLEIIDKKNIDSWRRAKII
jgi:hypothetical protein